MAALFNEPSITFGQLLYNLEHFCHCRVVRLDAGGIPDTDESESGALYEVTRDDGPAMWYAHIEVYHERLPVLPDLLRSYSVQLNLTVDQMLGRRPN